MWTEDSVRARESLGEGQKATETKAGLAWTLMAPVGSSSQAMAALVPLIQPGLSLQRMWTLQVQVMKSESFEIETEVEKAAELVPLIRPGVSLRRM